MRRNLVVLFFLIAGFVVTLFALLWGFMYDWPDFVHVDYGVPLTWATNTLSTIAGPANLWEVNISNLLIDLVFWFNIITIIVAVLLYRLKP